MVESVSRKLLQIIHFNDVYNIEENDKGQGGVSRFITKMNEHNSKEKLTLFSGDLFAPSLLSQLNEGE